MQIWSLILLAGFVSAETGQDAWLRYAPLPSGVSSQYKGPSTIVALNSTANSPVNTAGVELEKGIQGILGLKVSRGSTGSVSSSIVVGTADQYTKTFGSAPAGAQGLAQDGYWLSTTGGAVQIIGQNERGALYGAFQYLTLLATGNFSEVSYSTNPNLPIRWVNQWDNLDGSIERGYGGRSIFFESNGVKKDLSRVSQYGRLLASIGVNGIVINNVNANAALLSNVDGLAKIADALRPYGVQLGISLNFDSPKSSGGQSTSDPLNSGVINFWTTKTDAIYKSVPDFAGYLVKANSEGQPGPLTYGRTLAEGANMFAKALKPHGGVLMFRAFVYDQIQESNWKADRANAAVQKFNGLDGKFDDNVVVQVKYGPIDFQVREPASPLFSHLTQTNAAVELQVSQEYLGQQCHLAYLPPLWKTIFDFDMRVDSQPSLVKDIISGKRFKRSLGGSAAVVNVGVHPTWLGSHLAMSNLYAYGRLAWNPSDDVSQIVQDWTQLTFGLDDSIVDAVTKMSLDSWPAMENYTGNLGVQSLTDIVGNHYGVNPASQDGNSWGQWIRPDRNGVGMDRTVKNGTGNAGQYPPDVAKIFENLDSTPDNLVLWFHHVPYTYKLKSGKTVIQHFYDAHYDGAQTAQGFPVAWAALKGKMDDERFASILGHLEYQAGHAVVWRDAVNRFFHDLSRIEDAAGRVGNGTRRIEAEAMTLKNYRAATPGLGIAASGGRLVTASGGDGTASAPVTVPDGTYDVAVGYFDVSGGKASWTAYINDNKIGAWTGNNEDNFFHASSSSLDGTTAARLTFRGIQIKKGDTIKIVGSPNGGEAAPLDYVAFTPPGSWD